MSIMLCIFNLRLFLITKVIPCLLLLKKVLLGTDSHMCTAGVFGNCYWISNTDAKFVLGTGKLFLKELNMLQQVKFGFTVVFPVTSLDKDGQVSTSQIVARLLYQQSSVVATEKCCYFLAIPKLKSIS
ncbi:hypothetical protein ACH5RR_031422 [Cinchona calisaya]|uniref:Uncharacterized protein n=1 Tax=Cinchona calisaya TaxID=153742 RepID=A0ABD2YIN2_9GENT